MRPSLCLALSLSAPALSAQCFDSFGSLVGLGDDAPLQAIQSLGIVFPFAGGTYTDVHINNNGMVYLSNAGVPAPGTATGYSSSATTLSSNLRSGSQAKIAAFWDDLNNLAANGGGVKIDNTLGNRCVISWDNTVEFGQTVQKDIQLVLWANGDIDFVYNAGCAVQTGAALVGCGVGGAADPGQSDLSAGGATAVPTVYQVFPSTGPFDLAGKGLRLSPNAGGGFDIGFVCEPAAHVVEGIGCGGAARAFYEVFTAASANDLAGSTVRAVENGSGGYDVSVVPLGAFVAPTSPGLALTDDSLSAPQALGFTWDYPGNSTSSIVVDSNGRVHLNGADATDFSPSVAELLADAVDQIAASWTDLVPDGAANVNNVYFETDGVGEARITWTNVPHFTAANGPVTMQVVLLHTAAPGGDSVELRYQAVTGTASRDTIVGFATGPGARDPGNRDLTAAPFSTATDRNSLSVAAAPAPVLGNSVVFTSSDIPASTLFTVNVLGITPAGGIELLPGAPGCYSFVAVTGSELAYALFANPTDTNSVTIPVAPVFIGVVYWDQTVVFAPGLNAYGMITSNAVRGTINSF